MRSGRVPVRYCFAGIDWFPGDWVKVPIGSEKGEDFLVLCTCEGYGCGVGIGGDGWVGGLGGVGV